VAAEVVISAPRGETELGRRDLVALELELCALAHGCRLHDARGALELVVRAPRTIDLTAWPDSCVNALARALDHLRSPDETEERGFGGPLPLRRLHRLVAAYADLPRIGYEIELVTNQEMTCGYAFFLSSTDAYLEGDRLVHRRGSGAMAVVEVEATRLKTVLRCRSWSKQPA
jgi:hypothetical protein